MSNTDLFCPQRAHRRSTEIDVDPTQICKCRFTDEQGGRAGCYTSVGSFLRGGFRAEITSRRSARLGTPGEKRVCEAWSPVDCLWPREKAREAVTPGEEDGDKAGGKGMGRTR